MYVVGLNGKCIFKLKNSQIVSFYRSTTTSLSSGISAISLTNKPTFSLRHTPTIYLDYACTIFIDIIRLYVVALYEDGLESTLDRFHHFLSFSHLHTELTVLADLLLDLHLQARMALFVGFLAAC